MSDPLPGQSEREPDLSLMADALRWRLDQIVGVKDAARSLPQLIARNEDVVLTRRGRPQAVLVPLIEYVKLRNCAALVGRGIEARELALREGAASQSKSCRSGSDGPASGARHP